MHCHNSWLFLYALCLSQCSNKIQVLFPVLTWECVNFIRQQTFQTMSLIVWTYESCLHSLVVGFLSHFNTATLMLHYIVEQFLT